MKRDEETGRTRNDVYESHTPGVPNGEAVIHTARLRSTRSPSRFKAMAGFFHARSALRKKWDNGMRPRSDQDWPVPSLHRGNSGLSCEKLVRGRTGDFAAAAESGRVSVVPRVADLDGSIPAPGADPAFRPAHGLGAAFGVGTLISPLGAAGHLGGRRPPPPPQSPALHYGLVGKYKYNTCTEYSYFFSALLVVTQCARAGFRFWQLELERSPEFELHMLPSFRSLNE